MDRENQALEDSQSSSRNSYKILLIALLAFIVFLAVAVFIILTDTRGLWYPGFDPNDPPMQPLHLDFLSKAFVKLSF